MIASSYTATSTMIDYREETDTATSDFNDDYGMIVYYKSYPTPDFILPPVPGIDFQNKSPPVLVPNGETVRLPPDEPPGCLAWVWNQAKV